MPKITYNKATEILNDFITECDLDELAHIFGVTFGYDVTIDENEDFICTPNNDCGFVLEQQDEKQYIPTGNN